jgi:hypothetical protein
VAALEAQQSLPEFNALLEVRELSASSKICPGLLLGYLLDSLLQDWKVPGGAIKRLGASQHHTGTVPLQVSVVGAKELQGPKQKAGCM